jgi:hypothetical protein
LQEHLKLIQSKVKYYSELVENMKEKV